MSSEIPVASQNVQRAIAAAPDELDIPAISERFKCATQALTLLNEQASRLDAAVAEKRQQLAETSEVSKTSEVWVWQNRARSFSIPPATTPSSRRRSRGWG